MENTGVKKTVLIMLLSLGINYVGKTISLLLSLPLWLDSIGTGIAAGLLGPLYGAMCGVTSNLIYGVKDVTQIVFAITNGILGLIVGYCVKKGMLKKFFGVFNLSIILIIISVVVSTIISCTTWNGFTGNIWGSAVVDMLQTKVGWNMVTCSIIGQIFIEVPDKFIDVLCLYMVLQHEKKQQLKRLVENELKNNTKDIKGNDKNSNSKAENKTHKSKSAGEKIISALLVVSIVSAVIPSGRAFAEETGIEEVQTEASEDSSHDDTYYSSMFSSTIYSNDDGLGAGEANAIAQTTDGYIWVGTYAGLYSYNGNHFELQSEIDSVKNVNCLYVDEPGRLWVGTNDSGITLLVKGKVNTTLSVADGLASDSVRCITADQNGYYYIGTSDGMSVCSLDNGLKIVKTFDINYSETISVNEDGTVAVVNNEGTLFIIKDMEIVGTYKEESDDAYFTTCCFLRSGKLIVGDSNSCLYNWDLEKNKVAKGSRRKIEDMQSLNNIREDDTKDNYLWLCFDNGIGYIDQEGKFYKLKTSNFNSSVDSGMTDYQGNIWFTSSRLGLLKLSRNAFANVYQQVQLPSGVVNSVVMWNGKLYSGTDAGLDIIDLDRNKNISNELTDTLRGSRIRCLRVDSNNNLWICVSDGQGLYEVSPEGEITIFNTENGTVDNRFRSIIELSDGSFVTAENTGLTFIKDGKVSNTLSASDGLSCPQILSLAEVGDGTLLAGSDGNGIYEIKDGKVVGSYTRSDGLSSDVVMRITPCEDGYLIVTANGLCYMDADYKISAIDNFPYFNNFDTICMPNGKVWVLGSAGFYIVNAEDLIENNEMNYEHLDQKNGFMSTLTANSWSCMDESGNAYFCCSNGVYSINTNSYNTIKTSSRMRVEKIVIDDTMYESEQNRVIEVQGPMKKMEIYPVVFNYTLSNPYISYYLEGFESKPTVVRQSELTSIVYTNLPAGNYVFHMELLDNMQDRALEKCSYTIEKKKEFWENWWFTLYFILDGIFIVVFITYIILKSHSNRIIEAQKLEIEYAKKQAQMGNETILAIARIVDAKDDNTSQHSERVSEYSGLIAKKMGWSKERIEALEKVAMLHDIGKVGIPDDVLKKPDRLTDEEYKVMKSHVTIGGEILKDFSLVENVAEGAKYHHERYDGNGYVEGLKGEEIPINARIIGVADAFDAMTSNRVYRKHLDFDKVLEELKKGRGKQFDPEIVDILLELIDDGSIDINSRWS